MVRSWAVKFGPIALLVVAGIIGIPQNLFAESIQLDDSFQEITIGKSLEYYVDKSGELEFAELLKKESNLSWSKITTNNPNMGFQQEPYWFKFSLKNTTDKILPLYIQQAYPQADQIGLYVVQNGQLIQKNITGDHYPFATRPLEHRTFVFPIQVPVGKEINVYFRQKNHGPQKIFLKLHRPKFFQERSTGETAFLLMFYGLMVGMILYNLFIFISIRNNSYIHYVLFIIYMCLFTLTENGLGFQYLLPNSPFLINIATPFSIGMLAVHGVWFALNFLRISNDSFFYRLVYGLGIMGLLSALAPIFGEALATFLDGQNPGSADIGPGGVSFFYRYYTGFLALFMPALTVVGFYAGIRQSLKKMRQAYYYLAAWVALLFLGSLYALMSFGLLPATFLTYWSLYLGSGLLVVILSLGLADRINNMRRELSSLNHELEHKVEERTLELRSAMKNAEDLNVRLQGSLEEVFKLNEKQNGDYFLTSLLINPLVTNDNDSQVIRTEFKMEQYTKFKFRKHSAEIGGDLCITDNIVLSRRKYVVFINGDAMGKSIQGAGGVLVLGASFKAYLAAAKKNIDNYNLPELWLKDLYNNLQSLFVSFDGSMLISVVIGLVDEEQGFLYYLNSEHPWTVLYRDDQARFLDKSYSLRKLGTPGTEDKLHIKTFQMAPGDVFIAGSDGRDDIVLNNNGEETINDDHELFLKFVESSQGDLSRLISDIMEFGTLRDDFSLLKITCLNFGEAENIFQDSNELHALNELFENGEPAEVVTSLRERYNLSEMPPAAILLLARSYYALGNYRRSVVLLFRYLDMTPSDQASIYLMVKVLLKLGRQWEARAYLEALTLRSPNSEQFRSALAHLDNKRKQFPERRHSGRSELNRLEKDISEDFADFPDVLN